MVDCRIGSLETKANKGKREKPVDCRIGSLEIMAHYTFLTIFC